MGISEDKKRQEMLLDYVKKSTRHHRVWLSFWILHCADILNRYNSSNGRKKYGNRTMMAMLEILTQHPNGISQQSLARQTGRTRQMIVITIDDLEKKGYVKRRSDAKDRRINSIIITEKGINLLNEEFAHTVRNCNQALAALSIEEIKQLLPLIMKLGRSLRQRIDQ
jgi:DNA-binding MarR family transcriptional regulator